MLAQLLQFAARHDATADRWTAAAAEYHEAIGLARDTGYGTDLAATLAGLAWLEARQGKEPECRAHAAEAAALAAHLGIGTHRIWVLAALADLELSLGHLDLALEHLQDQQAALESLGIDDVDLSPAPELVEILVRLGDQDTATTIAATYTAQRTPKVTRGRVPEPHAAAACSDPTTSSTRTSTKH